jgi:hypothetical protein
VSGKLPRLAPHHHRSRSQFAQVSGEKLRKMRDGRDPASVARRPCERDGVLP